MNNYKLKRGDCMLTLLAAVTGTAVELFSAGVALAGATYVTAKGMKK